MNVFECHSSLFSLGSQKNLFSRGRHCLISPSLIRQNLISVSCQCDGNTIRDEQLPGYPPLLRSPLWRNTDSFFPGSDAEGGESRYSHPILFPERAESLLLFSAQVAGGACCTLLRMSSPDIWKIRLPEKRTGEGEIPDTGCIQEGFHNRYGPVHPNQDNRDLHQFCDPGRIIPEY